MLVWQSQGGYDHVIINVSQDFVVTLGHDISDGVRDHLKCRRAVDPAECNPRIQEVLIIPFDPKFQGVGWVHPQVPEGSIYINFCQKSPISQFFKL